MKYRHYKGGLYEILCEAQLEADPAITMVIYQSEAGMIWVRPKTAFFESVQHEGRTVPRFAHCAEATMTSDRSKQEF
jgi:hypothetical protein